MITFTLGEFGIPADSLVTPVEMKKIRREEFERAVTKKWGGTPEVLPFADTQLQLTDVGLLTQALMTLVRQKQYDLLVTFAPNAYPKQIDHPDHNRVGEVVQLVAAFSDVAHFQPEVPALVKRPSLYYWTTDKHQATHEVALPNQGKSRIKYLLKYYPSQFELGEKKSYKKLFSQVFDEKKGHQLEYYRKIR